MTDAKKFLFDTHDFSNAKTHAEATYSEEQLVTAKTQSFDQGKTEGLQEARKQQEERIAGLLQKMSELTERLAQAEARREMEKCVGAAKLALQTVHKLMPKFAARYALPEIEQVILQSLEARKDEARIAVTVPTEHLEALKGRMDAAASARGYTGKVILLADDALPPTDCRVEWADGGAERIYERIIAQIENEFTKAISGLEQNTEETGPS